MNEVVKNLTALDKEARTSLAAAKSEDDIQEWYRTYLGRKGRITGIMRGLGSIPKEERGPTGKAANELKVQLEQAFESHQDDIKKAALESNIQKESIDVTVPGRNVPLGNLHPTTRSLREIYRIFAQMGFQVYDSPDVETDEYNFELLNIAEGHPARDMWDTFYTMTPGLIMRTHTSPGQIHAMHEYAPEPIRVILPGKCYRNEDVTTRSEMMFYQVEGLAVGKDVTVADLKGVLLNFANQMFGPGRKLQFRKSYFPFTEPSVEVDVDCVLCNAKGCALCKYTGWLEILGAGMVNPTVLQNGGYDPAIYSGFAFGMGPERITMLKHGIRDIRYFFSNDVRFLERLGK